MKNLKKLLVTVAILALLVTGVVISVFATTTENAEFNRAKLFFSYVESERSVRSKSEELKSLYAFVATSSLNSSVEGFDEFKANYQAASVKIGYSLYEEAIGTEDAMGRLNALYQVRGHFKTCTVSADTEGYAELQTLITAELEAAVRELYNEAIAVPTSEDEKGEKRRELLLSVFAHAAAIPINSAEWDYYYFKVDYNTSSIEAAMSLAEIAAGMFAEEEAKAQKQYKEDLIDAIAAMYAEKIRDGKIVEGVANLKWQAAYDAKLAEEMAKENADLVAAENAAAAAADEVKASVIASLMASAEAAYSAAIADGKTAEEASLAYDKVIFDDAYAAYDKAYAEGVANLTAEAEAAYNEAYEAKLTEIYNAVYNEKYETALEAALAEVDLDAIYNSAYESKFAEEMAKEGAVEADAVTVATEAATAAKNAKIAEITEATDAAVKAEADAVKASEESVLSATEAAEAAKNAKIEEIENGAKSAAENALSAIKNPIETAALACYDSEYETRKTEFNATLDKAYDDAYEEAYNAALLTASAKAKAAYETAYTAAKNGGAEEADAVNAGFVAYWAAVEEEAQAAYAPVYKANYENALAILVTSADEKYKQAYDAALENGATVEAAKEAGKKAYDDAVNAFKKQLADAKNETAYNKVINDALKALVDSEYNGIYADFLVSVEYEFTLSARNAYNAKYQEAYEAKLNELIAAGQKRENAVTLASAAAKEAAEAAYKQAIAVSVEASLDDINTVLGKTLTVAQAQEALEDYYKASANAKALARCEEIKAGLILKAQESATAESAGVDVVADYKALAEAAALTVANTAYDAEFNKIVKAFCDLYKVSEEDAKKDLDDKAEYKDPIYDDELKDKYKKAVEEFEKFYSSCDIDSTLGSLTVAFDRLNVVLKEVSLTDARFAFVDCLTIPDEATDEHPYPLNERNSVLSKVQTIIDKNGLDASVEGFSEFYALYNKEKAKYDILLQKTMDALDKQANLEEFYWTSGAGYYEYKEDFSGGTPLSGYNQEGDTKVILGNENGNFNTTLHYGEVYKHLYVQPSFTGKYENGLVLNFDMKLSGDFKNIQFRVIGKNSAGTSVLVDPFTVKSEEGKLVLYYTNSESVSVPVKNILDTGVWNHYTLTYNHATHTGSIYVNYEYIGDVYYYDTTNACEVDFQSLRINAMTTFQEVSLDNLHFFAGTTYRDYYKFNNMTEGEIFKYCVDLFTDADLNPSNRNGAYVKAKGMYQSFVGNPSYNEYTKYFTDDQYTNYYIESIKNPAIKSNMEKIATMFSQIPERNSSNIGNVRAAINSIEKFISNNVDFLDRTSSEYIAQMAQLSAIEAEILRAEYVRDFVEALRFFDRATTLASMTKHYNKAKDIYTLAGYAKGTELVENDPAVTDFKLNDVSVNPFEYYLETAVEKMAVREAYENSRRIVDCLNFILDMKVESVDENGNVTVKGYEDTEEFWLANYEYINTYVTIIRNVVSSGRYDATYTEDGKPISEYIEKYGHINAYFYELLQLEHLEHLQSQFESFIATDSYIQKVGICNYIKKYVEDNDIDTTRPEFAEIINKVTVYEDELESQRNDYASILNQNTQYFITTINKMTAYVNYEDLIVLFEEATEYYYLMNIDSEDVKKAVEIYNNYDVKLASIQENSTLFIGYVREISAALKYTGTRRENALYAGLVNAMGCVDGIDMTYEGVEAAYATYTEQLAAYNNSVDAVNSDISAIADVTCAVRTKTVSKVVLAIIKTIFSN